MNLLGWSVCVCLGVITWLTVLLVITASVMLAGDRIMIDRSQQSTTGMSVSAAQKRTPHKHAAVIKAWADGAAIQYRQCYIHVLGRERKKWIEENEPGGAWKDWDHAEIAPNWQAWWLAFRVKPEPLEWQKERDAFAAGKTIQHRWTNRQGSRGDAWVVVPTPHWLSASSDHEYRIKPEPVERFVEILLNHTAGLQFGFAKADANLKLTFEDDKLVKAEVL